MKVFLYTDAGVRTGGVNGPTGGKSGPGSWAYVIRAADDKEILERGGDLLEETSVNEAEYSSLIGGLWAAKELGATKIAVRMDSQLVVMQVNDVWMVKAKNLRDYYDEVQEMRKWFEEFNIEWIPRHKNSTADEITRQIMLEHGQEATL